MLNVIGIVLSILVSSLWIFLPLRRVPENIRLKKSNYIVSIIEGAILCTALIIIVESLWDKVTGIDPQSPSTLLQCAAVSYTRAALLEEGAKYLFVKRVIKKYQPKGKMQYMLLAGTIGMGYGITEKLVMGSAIAMMFDAVFALHIMYQFIMGWYLYKASVTEDSKKKKEFSVAAYVVPFVLHGLWDFVQYGGVLNLDADDLNAPGVITVLVMFAVVISALVGEIKMALYLKRMEVSSGSGPETEAEPETESENENGPEADS